MKRRIRFCSALLVICLFFGALSVCAEPLWSEDYYRAFAASDGLSDAEVQSLDEDCIAFMERHHADLVLVADGREFLGDKSLEQAGEEYYNLCGFGYGETRDGFLWFYNTDTNEVSLLSYGGAKDRIPQAYIDSVTASAPEFAKEHGIFGVLYSGVRYLGNYLEEHPREDTDRQSTETVPPESEGQQGNLPPWYPEDPKNFTFFHDEAAPRVADRAGLFTAGQAQQLETRIAEIRQEIGKDIVIYTDNTSYGFERSVCAADFYDFNGYGVGEDREGVCLFICMDPADRGWWACCTGPDTRGLYTEENANLLDDALYEYMAAGSYAQGVADWIENIRGLYKKGVAFAPDWYPDRGTEFQRFHNDGASRVVDDAGLLSASEISALAEQAAEISRKHGLDVVIHTAPYPVSMSQQQFSDLFYYYNGYGYGEAYDGILLTLCAEPGYYSTARVTASGKGEAKLTEKNEERLREACKKTVDSGRVYDGLAQWLKNVDHMERTGRVPRSLGYWILTAAGGALLGSLFGGVALLGAKAKMRTPAAKTEADSYVLTDKSEIRPAGSDFLYTTTTRRYVPPEKSRSSGGSSGSGRSSHSSSYSGSSGSSHSGSGRNF